MNDYHKFHVNNCIVVPNLAFSVAYGGPQTRICHWFSDAYDERFNESYQNMLDVGAEI